MLQVPTLLQRAIVGVPLTIAQGDSNVQAIQNFLAALNQQVASSISDNGTLKIYFTDVGTPNSFQINPAEYVLTPQSGDYLPAYVNGLFYLIRSANTNTGASTLAVASSSSSFLTAIPLLLNGAPLVVGAIVQGQLFAAVYDLASNVFNVLAGGNSTGSSSSTTTTGSSTAIVPNLNTYSPADVALPGANTAATFPHGFNTAPDVANVSLVCITNNAGFTAGQVVPVSLFFNASNQPAFEIQVNGTDVIVTQGPASPNVIAPTGGSIGTSVSITAADWRLRVSAFIYTAPNIYQSPATPLPGANSLVTLPHGLTVNPNFSAGLVNTSAEQGYNPGDFVPLSEFFDANADPAFGVYSDTVNVYVEQNNLGTQTDATGTLTFSMQPGNGGTVVLGATTYTFQTVLVNSANNVLIGVNLAASIANLVSAIMAGAGAGTTYGTGTTANASATATAGSATVVAAAITPGTAGNSVASTPTVSGTANATWGASTLTGGVNAPHVICVFGANIGTAQPITPANWSISVFAFAPQKQTLITQPAVDYLIANPDGAFAYNNDVIVFNRGRLTNQTYISSIDQTDNGVSQLQVLPNSNFAATSQYNNLTPFRFSDGLDRLVWSSFEGIWSLVLGQSTGSAAAATGTLTFTGVPSNGDTVTVDGKVYTFQTTLTNVNGHVKIDAGGTPEATTIANLQAAMTLGPGAGTAYAVATTLDSNFTAVVAGSTIVVTATQPGTAGNSIATAATSTGPVCSWGASALSGGTGNSLVRYTTQDTHNQKPVWVDQTSSTSNPDFYTVGCEYNPSVTEYSTTSVPMFKTHYTGSAYQAAVAFGTNLNLHSPLINNIAAFNAFHNISVGNVATNCRLSMFQYNPVSKRIYVMDAETGYLFIFNIQLYTTNSNVSAWWNQSDATRYSQLTFEKAVAISGAGSQNSNYDRDRVVVCYDLTTGIENSIAITRVGNASTNGSVTVVGWQNNG